MLRIASPRSLCRGTKPSSAESPEAPGGARGRQPADGTNAGHLATGQMMRRASSSEGLPMARGRLPTRPAVSTRAAASGRFPVAPARRPRFRKPANGIRSARDPALPGGGYGRRRRMSDRPPPDIERLLTDHIGSVGTLEVLLVLLATAQPRHGPTSSARRWRALARGPSSSSMPSPAAASCPARPAKGWTYAPALAAPGGASTGSRARWERDHKAVSRWILKPRRRGRRGR